MTTYSAPVKDQQFILHEVLQFSQSNIPGYGDLGPAFTEAILNEAGQRSHRALECRWRS